VPRPTGAPGGVPRPPGAPGTLPRPPGAPTAAAPRSTVPGPPKAPPTVELPGQEFSEVATLAEAVTQPVTVAARPSSTPFVPPVAAAPPAAAPVIRRAPIPETGALPQITVQQAAELQRLYETLDSSDYFEILQLPQSAGTSEIKRAFYRESRIYHPDRIFHLTDMAPKQQLGDLYKRITEAYYVLRDDAKRKKYLADITGPERATKLRFTEASETEQKAEVVKAREDEFGTNPKARQFYKTALADIEKQNWSAAERNLKMALTFESSNAKFKEKMAEVQLNVEEIRKATHTGFTIK